MGWDEDDYKQLLANQQRATKVKIAPPAKRRAPNRKPKKPKRPPMNKCIFCTRRADSVEMRRVCVDRDQVKWFTCCCEDGAHKKQRYFKEAINES